MKIETSVETITPKMADEILSAHYDRITKGEFRQRTVSPITVARFTADMRNGLWLLSPEPIIFDDEGNLINGQHRLEAVKAAGIPIPFTISKGWPAKKQGDNGDIALSTIDVLDRGRTRSVGQQLQLHGMHNPNCVASSVTAAVCVSYDGMKVSLSYPQVVHILTKLDLEPHIKAIIQIVNSGQQSFTRAGRVVGPLAVYHMIRPMKAKEFAKALVGLNFKAGTGPHVFTQYVLARGRRGAGHGETPQLTMIKAICNALKYWDDNETVRHITSAPAGAKWLADQNPKFTNAIKNLVGPRRILKK